MARSRRRTVDLVRDDLAALLWRSRADAIRMKRFLSEKVLTRCELAAASLLTVFLVAFHAIFFLRAGPLWRDEISSLALATKPTLAEFWRSLPFDPFPACYFHLPNGVRPFRKSDCAFRVRGCVAQRAITFHERVYSFCDWRRGRRSSFANKELVHAWVNLWHRSDRGGIAVTVFANHACHPRLGENHCQQERHCQRHRRGRRHNQRRWGSREVGVVNTRRWIAGRVFARNHASACCGSRSKSRPDHIRCDNHGGGCSGHDRLSFHL